MGALREIRKVQAGRSFLRWFRETRQSELMVVAGEDIAALGGLVLAFIAVLLAMTTGNPLFDAFGSIGVGLLLVVISIAIIGEISSMIVGESAEPALRAAIEQHVRGHPEVKRVINLITLQWGAQIVVACVPRWHRWPPPTIAAVTASRIRCSELSRGGGVLRAGSRNSASPVRHRRASPM